MSDLVPVESAGPDEVALDGYVDLLADLTECQRMLDFWGKREKNIKEKLKDLMGNASVGTVNGEPALTYSPINRFQGAAFAKQYPDLARLYTREIPVRKLDEDWLRTERPQLWAEFQVRSMRNTWEAPGA